MRHHGGEIAQHAGEDAVTAAAHPLRRAGFPRDQDLADFGFAESGLASAARVRTSIRLKAAFGFASFRIASASLAFRHTA